MTTERNFDHLTRAWLELGPEEASDRVVTAVIEATRGTPQARRPRGGLIWRALHVTPSRVVAGLAAVVVVALVGLYLVSRVDTVGPSATPSTLPSAPVSSPSSGPTATAIVTSAAILPANLVVTDQKVFSWLDTPGSNVVQDQVIVEVENRGAGWARVIPRVASFKFLDGKGRETSSDGPFAHALPEYVAPGGRTYLVYGGDWPDHTVAQLADADVTFNERAYQSVAPQTVGTVLTDVAWAPSGTTHGLKATGIVTNKGPKALSFALLYVLCRDADGAILGYTSGPLQQVAIDVPVAFETATFTPPLQPRNCASAEGFLVESVDQN